MSHDPLFADRPARTARPKADPAAPPSRPSWFDFFLILVGFALSLLLTDLSNFEALPSEATPAPVARLLRSECHSLPYLLFLPLGVLLLWPVFYLTQRVGGRQQSLTAGEWLWGVAWVAAVTLTAWIAWQFWGTPPEFLQPTNFKVKVFVGYSIAALALAGIALLIGLASLFSRGRLPWTHSLCLALLMWPALPLLAVLLWKIELR